MPKRKPTQKRAPKPLPPVEHLNECLTYDPETGVFRWKIRPQEHFCDNHARCAWNGKFAGMIAGGLRKDGYRRITINDRRYFAHRIAYKIMTGKEPPPGLDHKDTDPSNNKWDNLRPATQSEQAFNHGLRKYNRSGHRGVHRAPQKRERWFSQIMFRGISYYLGLFSSPEGASIAYEIAARELHGEFYRNPNDQITAPPLKLARTKSR
jgi:hypothetical protein